MVREYTLTKREIFEQFGRMGIPQEEWEAAYRRFDVWQRCQFTRSVCGGRKVLWERSQ